MSNFLDRREKIFRNKGEDKKDKCNNSAYKISNKDVLALIIASIRIVLPLVLVLVVLYLVILIILEKFVF